MQQFLKENCSNGCGLAIQLDLPCPTSFSRPRWLERKGVVKMWMFILKTVGTALFIAALSEVAKRSTLVASLMVALPLATMLTVANIYVDGRDAESATRFATTTFFLVPPGLAFFVVLIGGQKLGLHFWPSFALSILATAVCCWAVVYFLRRAGIAL